MNEQTAKHSSVIPYQLGLVAKCAYYDTSFHAVALIICVLFYWPKIHGMPLIIWALSLSCALLLRCYANWNYQHKPITKPESWRHITGLVAAITGITWGYAGYWLAGTLPAVDQIPITLLIASVTVSSVGSLANYLPAFIGFTCCAILPVALRYLFNFDQTGFMVAVAYFSYLAALLFWGSSIHRSTLESFRLKLSNEQLVTELRQQKAEAEGAQLKAESANIAKSKFLASASHDLRQPLHAMGLLLHALEDRLHEQESIAIVQQIENSHQDMEKLFTALLDVSKLDAGVVDVRMKNFSAEEALTTLHKEFAPMAKEHKVELTVISKQASIRSDPVLLNRILRNLINNAIVHTDGGYITVGCTVKPKAIDIHISDTGAGIPEQELSSIFSEFHQLGNPERDQSKGLGLGLAIVKRLCALLGHDLGVNSIIGKGTTFTVTITRVTDENVPIDKMNTLIPMTPGHLGGTKILLIDDDQRIVAAMQELLNRWGIQTRTALTPAEALSALSSGFNPDIAICDYRLRENVTGVEVLHLLNKRLGRKLPALLITGDTAPERIKEAHTSGYTLMHKPVNPAKLRNAIAQQIRKIRKATTARN